MKQKIHSQKLVNWHKPLRSGEPNAAYRRARGRKLRAGVAGFAEAGAQQDPCVYCRAVACGEMEYSPLRCASREYREAREQEEMDLDEHARDGLPPAAGLLQDSEFRVFQKLSFSNKLPLPLELVDEAKVAAFCSGGGGKGVQEWELARHFKELLAPDGDAVRKGALGPLDLEHVRCAVLPLAELKTGASMPAYEMEYLTRLITLFSGFRTRPLSDWKVSSRDAGKELVRLANHLFCRYEVPAWLNAVWNDAHDALRGGIQRSLKWASWFVCIGGGGSLRKLSRHLDCRVTDGMVRHLHEAPAHLSPELACMWAHAFALGGKKRVADWILQHEGYHIDPTLVPKSERDFKFTKFWEGAVRWFARHERELSEDQAAELFEWGWFRFEHAMREGIAPFSWDRRTVRKVLAEAPAYLQAALRALGGETNNRWEAVGVDAQITTTGPDGSQILWRFEEFTQSVDLWEEGGAMRHCVARYDAACALGAAVMVSLTRDGERALTIELAGGTHTLVQARGRFNRPPTQEESHVVQQWLQTLMARFHSRS